MLTFLPPRVLCHCLGSRMQSMPVPCPGHVRTRIRSLGEFTLNSLSDHGRFPAHHDELSFRSWISWSVSPGELHADVLSALLS
jgi:hypothetical protein